LRSKKSKLRDNKARTALNLAGGDYLYVFNIMAHVFFNRIEKGFGLALIALHLQPDTAVIEVFHLACHIKTLSDLVSCVTKTNALDVATDIGFEVQCNRIIIVR